MSAAMEDYLNGLRKVEQASLDLLSAELRLADESASANAVRAAEDALALATRDLTLAVDALPVEKRPKGWDSL